MDLAGGTVANPSLINLSRRNWENSGLARHSSLQSRKRSARPKSEGKSLHALQQPDSALKCLGTGQGANVASEPEERLPSGALEVAAT